MTNGTVPAAPTGVAKVDPGGRGATGSPTSGVGAANPGLRDTTGRSSTEGSSSSIHEDPS